MCCVSVLKANTNLELFELAPFGVLPLLRVRIKPVETDLTEAFPVISQNQSRVIK